jgi:hypothetical protein
VPTFKDFLADMLRIRLKYRPQAYKYHRMPIGLDMPYLRHPEHQTCYIMPEYLIHYVEEQLKFMEHESSIWKAFAFQRKYSFDECHELG